VPIIGITGGIASGKSSFTSRLSRWLSEESTNSVRRVPPKGPALSFLPRAELGVGWEAGEEASGAGGVNTPAGRGPIQVFDADAVARELVAEDFQVQDAIVRQFGNAMLTAEGIIDRGLLRENVFGDNAQRKALEAILHPVIRARWTVEAQAARRTGAWLLLDIPLLYETGAESECDVVVVVACQEETQRARIVSRRGLTPEMAGKIIATQTSLASKAARADYMVWNDAPEARLEEQAELFAGYLILWMNNLPL